MLIYYMVLNVIYIYIYIEREMHNNKCDTYSIIVHRTNRITKYILIKNQNLLLLNFEIFYCGCGIHFCEWCHQLGYVCHAFGLQGEPCEVCPVLPADLGNTVALPGKRGPKGEPGSPGIGERGLPVSPTLWTLALPAVEVLFDMWWSCWGGLTSGCDSKYNGHIFFSYRSHGRCDTSLYLGVVFVCLFYILVAKQLKEKARYTVKLLFLQDSDF